MPSLLDQATVFTEFTKSFPVDIAAPLRPHIAGPIGELHYYNNSAEKSAISVGAYNPGTPQTYDYPAIGAGSIVDLASVAVYIDDALLQYFSHTIGNGSIIAPVSGFASRIKTANADGFKTNTSTYPRQSVLGDRDVQIGDIVTVSDNSGHSLVTSVAALIADQVNAVIGSATSDAGDAPTQPDYNPTTTPTVSPTGGGASGGLLQAGTYYAYYTWVGPFGETNVSPPSLQFTVASGDIPQVTIPALPTGATSATIYLSATNGAASTATRYLTGVTITDPDLATAQGGGAAAPFTWTQTSGTVNDVLISAITDSGYDGTPTGDINETYTIVVTTGGVPASAVLQVISASGRDNVASVTPAAFSSATTIGARGLTVTFSHTSTNFVAGQTWVVPVGQAWTAPVPTSAGTYTGTSTVTYIITVTRGGLYADSIKPQITVTTDRGFDRSGPTTVSANSTPYAIGTLGVTISFSGNGLRDNDIYYVPVTGPMNGAYKTILLQNNLPSTLTGASDLNVALALSKNIVVNPERVDAPPALNWSAAASTVTVENGITATDSSFTNGGNPFYTPVEGGTVYISYRAWTPHLSAAMYEVVTQADCESTFGLTWANTIPDHMLPYAVMLAVQNANAQPVRFSGVADPTSLPDWQDIVNLITGYNDVFSLVPLSRTPAVISAYQTAILARSSSSVGGEWRNGWFNLTAVESLAIVDQALSLDSNIVMATLGNDPEVSGTHYTLFTVTTGNAKFVTNGVLPGDQVRYLFTVDAFGNPTYTTFTVDHVINEDSLVVTSGNLTAVTQTQQLEVWRNLTQDQVAANLAGQLTGANLNSRFRFVWPDKFTDANGNVADGFHLCAIYAAMTGGIAAQQGLRLITLDNGISAVPRSTVFFNNGQLNTLATAGFVIATQDPSSGSIFTLFARTPDSSSPAAQEEATVRLDDAISYLLWNTAMSSRGNANVTGAALAQILNELQATINHGIANTYINARVGSMIISATVDSLAPSPTVEDRIVASFSVTRPFPLNDATLTISF